MGTKNKKLFTEEEDKEIVLFANEMGINQASLILAGKFGRSRRSIKERYQNSLDPVLDPIFTEEQDEKIISMVNQVGKKWKEISIVLKNKSASMVKGRYHRLIEKMKFGIVSDDGKHLKHYYERKFGMKNAKKITCSCEFQGPIDFEEVHHDFKCNEFCQPDCFFVEENVDTLFINLD